jgi:hypothetical protein
MVPRAGATITVGDAAVVVRSPDREMEIGLAPARLEWARRHFGDRSSYRG